MSAHKQQYSVCLLPVILPLTSYWCFRFQPQAAFRQEMRARFRAPQSSTKQAATAPSKALLAFLHELFILWVNFDQVGEWTMAVQAALY